MAQNLNLKNTLPTQVKVANQAVISTANQTSTSQVYHKPTELAATSANWKSLWQSSRSLIFFILLLILVPQIEAWIGATNIKNFITSAGIWAPIIFIFVRLVTVVIAPLKLGPITIILHRAFGLWPSIFYTILVTVLGSCTNFLLSQRWGNRIIGFFFGADILKVVDKYAQKYLDKNLATSMLLFLTNYELVSYASGLTKVKFWQVFLASLGSAVITAPLLVVRDLNIGVNDTLASGIFIFSYLLALTPLIYVTWQDIVLWWQTEMHRLNSSNPEHNPKNPKP